MYDLIVIGGGPAGVTAALQARELGVSVALVERAQMGGTCTNDGCVPTRVLAKAARLMRDASGMAEYGLDGPLPAVDLSAMLAKANQIVYQMHEKKQIVGHLRDAGVDVMVDVGDSQFVDPNRLRLGDGRLLTAEKFVIAAGGRARLITFPGSEHTLTHHDVWQMHGLPQQIAIIGGAATGCQLASVFAAFGVQVTILELAPRILPAEDPLTSSTLAEVFTRHGIEIITGVDGVERVAKDGDAFRLTYRHAGRGHTVSYDAVIMAVGWVGNGDRLNVTAAGVALRGSFVAVNDYLQTSAPHIFAAGDITGRMMLVQSGSYEGRIAAQNAVLGTGQRYAHQIVPHGGFTDPEYGSVGLTEPQARAEHDTVVAVVPYADLDRAVIDGRTDGFCKLIVSRETHRILGAHIVGEQALEAIQLVAAGMASGIWVEQLGELELAYPTYTAAVGVAARRVMFRLGVTPVAPQWRALTQNPLAEWERREYEP